MPEMPTAEDEILSDIAHKLVDQVALYGLAKDLAAQPDIADAIQRAKTARAELLQEINGKIWLHGIPPIDQGDKLGTAHKAFARLRALQGKSDAEALGEVKRGEAYLRDRIERVAQDERLGAHTRNYLLTVVSRIETTLEELNGYSA